MPKIFYIDTHLDTMWQSSKSGRSFGSRSTEGHIDLHRAREAGLAIGFFTGFPTDDMTVTSRMMDDWTKYFKRETGSAILQIFDLGDVDQHLEEISDIPHDEYRIGVLLHFEGAAGIDKEMKNLDHYYELGLRSMSLTWNETNHWGTGAKNEGDRGLTELGIDLVSRMEDLGIMIDASHLNDQSFWDLSSCSKKPIYASHSNVRLPSSSHKRNLEPDMVRAIADSGGSVGINFCKAFLRDDEDKATIETVVGMFGKVIDLVGVDHVHVGSDMDGCTMPRGMKDITVMPELFEKLESNLSLSSHEIQMIASGNMLRIMAEYLG